MFVTALALVVFFYPNKIHSDESKATQWQTPFDVLTDTSTKQQIKEAISFLAIKYGIEKSTLIQTLICESGLIHKGVYGDHNKAYGIAQYHEDTFNRYCEGDYYNIKDQLRCMASMMKEGLGFHWTCWKQYVLK